MNTILGANGIVARELSRALSASTDRIRQASRHPQRVNASDETVVADLLDPEATARAVAGSRTAYLVAGLKYSARVWEEQWPRVMRHTIDACKRHGTRLVFLDNVYAYGRVEGAMTEETPCNPCSRKGEVRAKIATMLLDEMRSGELDAMIVRAADFYGPGATNSFPQVTVFDRLKAGRSPRWIGDPQAVHSFTYTPDLGDALAVLGQTESAYGQVWHAPTSREPLSGEAFVRLACEQAGRPYTLQSMSPFLMRALSWVVPVLRENQEMMYQFDHDYRFDSRKVEARLGLAPTPYRQGIAAALAALGRQ
jgi:nucleoside-diphosphate-sugar epimerase